MASTIISDVLENSLYNVCIARGRTLIWNFKWLKCLKTENVIDAVNATVNIVQQIVFEEVHIESTEEVL